MASPISQVNDQQDSTVREETKAAAEAKAKRDSKLSKTDLDSKEFQAGKYVEHVPQTTDPNY